MRKPNISFFCPAYYDAGNLPGLISDASTLFAEIANEYEIIIIEDGSPDNTGEVADQLTAKFPHVRVIHHEQNLGYGTTIAEGFKIANKYEWVCYTDGDHQYDIKELKTFLPYIQDYDAIVGYRRIRQLSPYRKFQSAAFSLFIRILFGLKFKDIDCSMKLIRRSCMNGIELRSHSALVDSELMLKLKTKGARVFEVPVNHFAREHGVASGAKFRLVFQTIVESLKLKAGWL